MKVFFVKSSIALSLELDAWQGFTIQSCELVVGEEAAFMQILLFYTSGHVESLVDKCFHFFWLTEVGNYLAEYGFKMG